MNDTTTTGADNYFAIIPEWVLFSAISSNAIRLYCVLRRRADKQSGKCYPSRKTIAEDLQVGSVKTVDRAMKELVEIGAVKVFHRSNKDEYTSNIYTVMTMPPEGSEMTLDSYSDEIESELSLGSPKVDTRVGTNLGLGRVTDVDQTKVIKPKSFNQSHLDKDFARFWDIYPIKMGKGAAIKAWAKAITRDIPEIIIQGAERYAKDPNREPEFTAYPATWLNADRWLDCPLPSKRSQVSNRGNFTAPTIIPPHFTAEDAPKGVPAPANLRNLIQEMSSP